MDCDSPESKRIFLIGLPFSIPLTSTPNNGRQDDGLAVPQTSDLFQTTVAAEDLHPAYVHVRDHPRCTDTRRHLDTLWAKYRDLADPHFLDQFQQHFPKRVWEMRLACALK